ncbi:uncharacterized protein LOC101452577 [Ceratitis capitata]|uniref:uncharacterized protein LOC101452577 n=1 Tax=Ceratitis capitata TaxID=7213 RepID=UPI000329E47B|nr:uncharacterized protein LOC101452577 [Ceratitis capitata]
MEKSLLDLNDDCLIEIFKYLSLVETFNLMDICNARLSNIARQRISTIKKLNIRVREFHNLNSKQLKIIGENLNDLTISAGYSIPAHVVLNILQPICEGAAVSGKMSAFALNYIFIDKAYSQCIAKVASNLQKLNLNNCQLTDELLTELLRICCNLVELQILGNYTLSGNFLHNLNLPSLRVLKLEMHAEWIYPIAEFKIKNPNVTLLT